MPLRPFCLEREWPYIKNARNDMHEEPLVSIVCPTYNSQDFIEETIKSTINQSYKNWELIIVDDCSNDATAALVKKYLPDSRIQLHRLNINSGPANARNMATRLAKGQYIAFLDSDDVWKQRKLEDQIGFMQRECREFSYTQFELIDEQSKSIGRSQKLPYQIDYEKLLKHCLIQNSTVIYDIRSIGKIMSPSIRRRQDFALFLKILKKIDSAYLALTEDGRPQTTMQYRIRRESVSSKKLKNIRFQWEVYKDIENLGNIRSSYLLANWFLRSGLKNLIRLFS